MEKDSQFELARETPYYQHLGIELVEAHDGLARLRLAFKDSLSHPFKNFHGGAIASLADSAGINAVLSVARDGERVVTLEMKINFLQAASGGTIVAEGRVVHRGRRFAVSDVTVEDGSGRVIAKAIVTCAVS